MNLANQLFEDGVVVISSDFLLNNLHNFRSEFDSTIKKFPEFKIHPGLDEIVKDTKDQVLRYGLGGTSFIGNPSVFHAHFFRKMREIVMYIAIEKLFRDYKRLYLDPSFNIEQIIDRIMIRPPKDIASAEAWHRDEAPKSDVMNGDLTFGGWINYDKESQYFSCVKGTHKNLDVTKRDKKKGFHKVDKSDIPTYKENKCLVEIPPASIIIFIEDLVHEIFNSKKSIKQYTSIRQFFGWRLTKHVNQSIHGDNLRIMLQNQSVIPLKSGQTPALYPKTCIMYTIQRERKDKFIEEALIRPEILDVKTRSIKSLKEINVEMYKEYGEREIKMLFSNNTFELTNPYTNEMEVIVL
jgi:hypothetical protein